MADSKNHIEALIILLANLAAAGNLPQSKITQKILYKERSDNKAVILCFRITSSTTLNESIFDSTAKKVHFQFDIVIGSNNKKR
jgi:hypothetical protein